MNDKAVVFFSRDGSTRIAANIIAEKIGAELIELQEEKPNRNFLMSGFRASTRKHAALSGDPWAEIASCNTLILGAPIWAGKGIPAMNGFLDKIDLSGKHVYLFTLQADPNLRSSGQVIAHYTRRVEDAGGTVDGSIALPGNSPGKTGSEKDIRTTLEKWSLFNN
ncbi:MAG: hypothetical protein JEY99_14450 [Spirochaetales bacterium]|nr:hypothetical protein [Spirochaetales bacterium]